MKITDIKTFHANDGQRNNIFLEIETDEGITGTGEAYSIGPDTSVISMIDEMKSWFIGQDPGRIEWLIRRAKNTLRFPLGQVAWSAISGIDLALWDIAGKAAGLPVYSLLGGKTRDRVRVYHGIYGDSPAKVGEHAVQLMDEGYSAFKTSPLPSNWREIPWRQALREADERMVAIRDAIGDSPDLAVDVHVAIRETTLSLELARVITPYRLMFIEEPSRAEFIDSAAELRREFRVALATGENLYGLHRYTELLNADAVDIIQPDMLCCGGLLEAKKIAAVAEAHYVTVAPHNPLGLLSTAAGVHHSASINNFAILEWHGDHKKKKSEFINETWVPVNGYFELPTQPGLGMTLNHEVIAANPPAHWDRGFATYSDGSPGFL
ncbi:MAG TPA: mandelate racemase/muconate lactonizing enzyme family protein [Dehalococcoidia bacterium]|jgi:galactonate dehydratase|nr:mandelate racemase/muconate lactonizing enzyme family protein [Dehalococcoidia bacterium]HIK89321.1 mandelate racemase/muconate lactonizing enzyme family protein [Dehalococcoidia bacterium]